MKTQKISYQKISKILTREEMKKIMAGSFTKCGLKCIEDECPVTYCECRNAGTQNQYCGKR